MKTEEFRKKVKEFIFEQLVTEEEIDKYIDRSIQNGLQSKIEDSYDYVLVKCFVNALCQEFIHQTKPLNKENRKEATRIYASL